MDVAFIDQCGLCVCVGVCVRVGVWVCVCLDVCLGAWWWYFQPQYRQLALMATANNVYIMFKVCGRKQDEILN